MESVIYHVDVNSAFLSWTAAERLRERGGTDLRTIPAVVAGDVEARHGIVLAKSGPARACGVRTGEPLWQARAKCPALEVVRPDYRLYGEQSRRFVGLLREAAPVVEQYSIDEAWADMTGMGWSAGEPLAAAERLRERIKRELGFTVNIGVSSNKLLSKMAGDFQKPDRVHSLFPAEVPDKLWPLPARELFFVGPATERKLAYFGIHTIGDIARADPDFLRARLHRQGEVIWNYANGRAADPVTDEILLNKGYGNSTTTARDVTDALTAHRILLSLCETVGMRLRRDGQTGSVMTVHIRNGRMEDVSHQQPLAAYTAVTEELWRAACRCFDELWDGKTPLRQLGVHVGRVARGAPRQYNFFDGTRCDRLERLDAAVDAVREKYGEGALFRACFLRGDAAPLGGGLSPELRTGVIGPV